MKLIDFISRFPDENSCRAKFKEYRDLVGVTCPKCGCKVHYWVGGKSQRYECKHCGYRQSLRANTVLHHSHATYREWFLTMHLLTSTKNNLSVAEIQRQLGRKYWHAVWVMVSKIRDAMGRDDDQHKLSGEIEIDEAFFRLEPVKDNSTREHLTPVLVMAESEQQTDSKLKIHRKFAHIKMKVVQNITAGELKMWAERCISKDAVLRGDGTKNHNYMKSSFREVSSEILKNHSDILRSLPWVHICIGDSKNRIRNVYHDVTREYLQLYLNEFCWKKNHRYDNLFYELIRVSVSMKNKWMPVEDFDMISYLEKRSDIFSRL